MKAPNRTEGMRFASILILLVAMLPATWGLRQLSVGDTASNIEARKLEAIGRAFADIQSDLDAIQLSLLTAAQRLGEHEDVITGLSQWAPGSPPDERLVRLMASLDLPERVAVEVYNPAPQLVVWNGFSMPLDDGPSRDGFLDGILTGVAQDVHQREALVIWWPVSDGLKVVGAVRIMELMELRVPVENEYLKRFSQTQIWSRRARLPIQVIYDAPFDDELPPDGDVRLLSGLDGTALGRVFIDTPEDAKLIGNVRDRYNQVLAFWATLALCWIAAGSWMLFRKAPSSSGPLLLLKFAGFSVVWWTVRYLLIALDVPARYQTDKAPLSPLFDPAHLASSFGFGLLRSSGDLLLSATFALLFAAAALNLAGRFRRIYLVGAVAGARPSFHWGVWLFGLVLAGASVGLALLLGLLSRVTILDSTLDYFARTGLLPERLVLVVFSGLLIATIAFVLFGIAIVWFGARVLRVDERSVPRPRLVAGSVIALALVTLLFGIWGQNVPVPWHAVIILGATLLGGAVLFIVRVRDRAALLTLRNVLPSIFVLTAILYPLFYRGMEVQRGVRMVDAADSFEDGRDSRVIYGVEHVLEEAARASSLLDILEYGVPSDRAGQTNPLLDSLSTALLRGSFLASLGSYDVSMTLYNPDGVPAGRYYEVDPRVLTSTLGEIEQQDLRRMRVMYSESGKTGPLTEPLMGSQLRDQFQYHGIFDLRSPVDDEEIGWAIVRAEPRTLLRESAAPFPRVLVPAGFYGNLHPSLSVAVFRNGALIRSTGDDFGRYRLPEEVVSRLPVEREVWIRESIREKDYEAYYRLQEDADPVFGAPSQSVVAVRIPSISVFDHLYNLLRLTFGGLIIGVPIYLAGLLLRRQQKLLPAPRVRFRDKILNAFFGVGVVTVAAMGVVGLNVVTGENQREVESWLRQHLERIERTIVLDAAGGEMAYRVLERTRIDSLAARVGLDINVYKDNQLVSSSRPQLVRDRLIDPRLPIRAYEALYVDGFMFAEAEQRLGRFSYTAGFRAIPDEIGRPHYVVSVPTLPEQERIEEDRARTVAYLFGALLLLVLVVMITASLLANALTRPIARLREGIEAVSRGRFNRIRPLDTRDEIGELVVSFNTMQDQLSESRRRLAQQERQLAWREMARQVAHEIKNPLTPMKLSVQHLRRSFESGGKGDRREFANLFERITTTLTEQIDALARIANEFSSFARMPQRVEESLDLNAVVAEAVTLMEAEVPFDIDLTLEDRPLTVNADREELRRIYINLIKNAIQSIPEDRDGRISVSTRLETTADESAPWAHSSVADNGAGIPEELRSKIFVPNFSTKTSGTGLGLAIVRKSVEDLHGEIGFVTGEKTGTTFWVKLPLDTEGPEEE